MSDKSEIVNQGDKSEKQTFAREYLRKDTLLRRTEDTAYTSASEPCAYDRFHLNKLFLHVSRAYVFCCACALHVWPVPSQLTLGVASILFVYFFFRAPKKQQINK